MKNEIMHNKLNGLIIYGKKWDTRLIQSQNFIINNEGGDIKVLN